MKINKLVITILGLSQINNVKNRASAIQIEKEVNMPYEILARDNWDNSLMAENLVQNEVSQLTNQNIFVENSESLTTPTNYGEGCWAIYLAYVAACQALYLINPSDYGPCMRQAWATYMACRHG